MYTSIEKIVISFFLITCMVLIASCGESKETNNEPKVSEQPSSDDLVTIEKSVQGDDRVFGEEEDKLTSEFEISQTEISSVVYKSSTEVDSEFSKEVMEALSEFDAVNIEDGTKLTLPEDILFDFDSSELLPEADEAIDQLVKVIETTDDEEEIAIVGHTDGKGEEKYNQKLSEKRAQSVRDALADEGVKKDRMTAEGKGDSEPVAENTNSDGSDNPEGRQKNRRVEVTVHGLSQ